MNLPVVRLTPLILVFFSIALRAAPAPAPILQMPVDRAPAVATTTTLRWSWQDSLLVNGAFEQGLANGWQLGGPNPGVWTLWNNSDIESGTNIAEAFLDGLQTVSGSLIQQVSLPPTLLRRRSTGTSLLTPFHSLFILHIQVWKSAYG